MKFVRSLVVVAAVSTASSAFAGPAGRDGKYELLTLYLLSVAAERCGFPMTNKQVDLIEQETKNLIEKLKLGPNENDAVYSEADITFEKQGAAACDRNGNFAKGFRQTLQSLTGP